MLCTAASAVVSVRHATGALHYQHGSVALANGASFEIGDLSETSPEADFVRVLRRGDRIEICYAPRQRWADEPENARMALIVNTSMDTATYMYGIALPPHH